ncbi:unnamed protein product [Closterium sp. Yama58-4]|nr:unnamed protein product [Closterium sp. Yama58-4]
MAVRRVFLLVLSVLIAAAHVVPATAEFKPSLATLAARLDDDGLLAAMGDVRGKANAIIRGRALAEEDEESLPARDGVFAADDLPSPEVATAPMAVEGIRRMLRRRGFSPRTVKAMGEVAVELGKYTKQEVTRITKDKHKQAEILEQRSKQTWEDTKKAANAVKDFFGKLGHK